MFSLEKLHLKNSTMLVIIPVQTLSAELQFILTFAVWHLLNIVSAWECYQENE